MWFAEIDAGGLIRPGPDQRASCPTCHEDVYARCGAIISWHWAHLPTSAYAPGGGGPESCWHAWGKAQFPQAWREQSEYGHRADVLTPAGLALEFQRGILARDQVAAREDAWPDLLWIFYAVPALAEEDAVPPPPAQPPGRGECWPNDDYPSFWLRHNLGSTDFWWRRPRPDALAAAAPAVLDIGYNRCLRVRRWPVGRNTPGLAERWERDMLFEALRGATPPLPAPSLSWGVGPAGLRGWC